MGALGSGVEKESFLGVVCIPGSSVLLGVVPTGPLLVTMPGLVGGVFVCVLGFGEIWSFLRVLSTSGTPELLGVVPTGPLLVTIPELVGAAVVGVLGSGVVVQAFF